MKENDFDIVLLNEAVTAKAKPIVDKHNLPSIYISHNVDADIRPQIAAASKKRVLRWVQMLDAAKYRKMELGLLKQIQGLTTISREDQDRYKELGCAVPSKVLKPGYAHSGLEKPHAHDRRNKIAVLVGSFEWNAKISNLEMILAAYEKYTAGISLLPFRLRIAGKAPPKVVKRLSARYPEVEFMCPFEHLSDVVKDARVALVLEEMGGGFKLKTLDYIFSDLAIVAFAHAMQGTELTPGLEYQDAPTMEKAIEIVHQLIGDVERLEDMTYAARQKAETEYDWNTRAIILLHLAEAAIKHYND
ncbi:glycosyltransferase [Celeribacter baekdonensis B30]|uniref:Glycosyltransferase n=1 Tax=Celeribacter baekdonensis B30 TaxID=1208323 RepID=K2JGN6_9RHOB|nr:glycosyltransferase [Celeribacter baekdonensis B30]